MRVDGVAYREVRARLIPVDNAAVRKVDYRPIESHYDTVLCAPSIVTIDNEPAIVAEPAPPGAEMVRAAAQRIKRWDGASKNDGRVLGLRSVNRTFGFRPRLALRADFCSRAVLWREEPAVDRMLGNWSRICSERLRYWMPKVHAEQSEWLDANVLPEWRLPESVYTSGIVNKMTALGYHRDQGNHEGSWSSMLAIQRDTEGGLLVMPELRLAFDFTEPTLIMFDGMRILHGVTKIRAKTPQAYRYSVVWYCREQLKACMPHDQEIERIQQKTTEREVARATMSTADLAERMGPEVVAYLRNKEQA